MSADKRWRLICYDIRDPKRYRAAYKIIRGHGRRLQYSIFRCRLDDQQVEALRWRLARELAPEDSLLVIDLCPGCAGRVIAKNHVSDWTEAPVGFTIVRATDTPMQADAPDGAKKAVALTESPVGCTDSTKRGA